jgi:hypothetical protein
MKNKPTKEEMTIQILTEGKWKLPVGTKVKTYASKEIANTSDGEHITDSFTNEYIIDSDNKSRTGHIYEVDFSEIPPLYPHKGMDVPKEGIEFEEKDTLRYTGKLIDVGQNGVTFENGDKVVVNLPWSRVENRDYYKLKQTLPKTKTVCSGCFKGPCECVHADGWYRVKLNINDKWMLRYWVENSFYDSKNEDCLCGVVNDYSEIDWDNMINVEPEKELSGSVSINLNSVRAVMVHSMRDLVEKLNDSTNNDLIGIHPLFIKDEIRDLSNNIAILSSAFIEGDKNFKDLTGNVPDIPEFKEVES